MLLKKITAIVLSVFLFPSLSWARSVRQQPVTANPTGEAARIERLVGLAKVWGTVKYFHPFLAYRNIDWDRALVETIPKVNAATTAAGYQDAGSSMLMAF